MHKPKPVYLLAGRSDPTTQNQLIQNVFKGNGVTSPSIAYIGTAHGDSDLFFQRIADRLKKAGARQVTHALISTYNADIKKAQDVLSSADIIFISGGDVEEGMQVLNKKNLVDFLGKLYKNGKPFFGLSAGSIMLSMKWVRWSDPTDDSTATLFPCLGFAPIICDTHSEHENWEELQITLKLAKDKTKGYGIVSGAAIKVYSSGKVEAFGKPIHQFIRCENKIVRESDILPSVRV